YPVEAALVGDSRRVLQQLLPLVRRNDDRGWLEQDGEAMRDWRELLAERGTRGDVPMKPEVVTHELDPLLADDAIIVTDSGTVTTWVARHIRMRGRQMFSCSGTLATMACAIPYAVAAALAFPERQVVA